MPSAAPWAATELARLPVEAQASDVVAELAGAGRGDRDDAVLERVRRVRGVVLDPDLAQAEALGEPVGADQRRAAGGQAAARRRAGGRAGLVGERQEVRVAPDVLRARPGCGGAAGAGRPPGRRGRRRPRAARSSARRRTAPRARTPPRIRDISGLLAPMKKPPPVRGGGSSWSLRPHLVRNWHRSRRAVHAAAGGCRGFIGPVPPPLWMCPAMWRHHTSVCGGFGRPRASRSSVAQVDCIVERIR